MPKTTIEWVRCPQPLPDITIPDGQKIVPARWFPLGHTLNHITGCLNHTPEGLCLNGLFPCYAYKLANGRLRRRYLANDNLARSGHPIPRNLNELPCDEDDPFYPRLWMDRVEKADRMLKSARKPLGIFPCDMGEWAGDWVPESWQDWYFELMRRYPQHRWYSLTKQPQNLPRFSPFPDNCWVGETATGGEFAWSAGAWIRMVKAKIKFLSVEPFLMPFYNKTHSLDFTRAVVEQFNWIIIGACTGTKPDMEALCKRYPDLTLAQWGNRWTAQPKIEWVDELVEATSNAGIPVFLKDNLMGMTFPNKEVRKHHNLSATVVCVDQERELWRLNNLRQEMPNV